MTGPSWRNQRCKLASRGGKRHRQKRHFGEKSGGPESTSGERNVLPVNLGGKIADRRNPIPAKKVDQTREQDGHGGLVPSGTRKVNQPLPSQREIKLSHGARRGEAVRTKKHYFLYFQPSGLGKQTTRLRLGEGKIGRQPKGEGGSGPMPRGGDEGVPSYGRKRAGGFYSYARILRNQRGVPGGGIVRRPRKMARTSGEKIGGEGR